MHSSKHGIFALLALVLSFAFFVGCKQTPKAVSQQESPEKEKVVATEKVVIEKQQEKFDVEIPDFKIFVPFAAGGSVDLRARAVADTMQKQLGNKIAVENVTGGGGTVCAVQFLSKIENPYDMLFSSPPPFTLSPIVTETNYSLDSIIPIAATDMEEFGLYVCTEKSGLKTMEDVIGYGKDHQILFGSGGPTTNLHLLQQGLYDGLGLKTNSLSHNGAKEGIANIMGGHSTITMAGLELGRDYVKEGLITPVLAYTENDYTGYEGYTVPSVIKYGDANLARGSLMSFIMPASTDPAIIEAMTVAVHAAMADLECQKMLASFGGNDRSNMTMEELKNYYVEEAEVFSKILNK